MRRSSQFKLFSGLITLFLISAICAGFLVGRSVRLQEEGKYEQLRVSEQVVTPDHVLQRGAQIIRRALLR